MKLICWNDMAIPVPDKYKWMAWDQNGWVYLYSKKPEEDEREWKNPKGEYEGYYQIGAGTDLPPPESGDWTEQLYYIG